MRIAMIAAGAAAALATPAAAQSGLPPIVRYQVDLFSNSAGVTGSYTFVQRGFIADTRTLFVPETCSLAPDRCPGISVGFSERNRIGPIDGSDPDGVDQIQTSFLFDQRFTRVNSLFEDGALLAFGTYESLIDNPLNDGFTLLTVSFAGVPEPATWAMMIAGFGMVGAALRFRIRRTTQPA